MLTAGCSACCDLAAIVSMQLGKGASRQAPAMLGASLVHLASHKPFSARV